MSPNDLGAQGTVANALKRLVVTYKDLDSARSRLVEVAEPEEGFGLPKDGEWLSAATVRTRAWSGNERHAPRWCASRGRCSRGAPQDLPH
jgi:hypothetical protein